MTPFGAGFDKGAGNETDLQDVLWDTLRDVLRDELWNVLTSFLIKNNSTPR
jgi:hypothetical protein